MIRTNAVMKLLTTVLLTVATAFAQSSDRLPVTDAEKIADALRAGPAFIAKDATVLDWPSAPGGEYRLFARDRTNGPVSRLFLGIRTMSQGASTPYSCAGCRTALPAARRTLIASASRTCISASGNRRKMAPGHEFHVGPHLMVVSPNQDDFQRLNRDPTNGMPYVTHLPNRTELFLVMPVRQWNE